MYIKKQCFNCHFLFVLQIFLPKLFQIHLKIGVKKGKFWLKMAKKRAKKWKK
jgi:hypothetical protein